MALPVRHRIKPGFSSSDLRDDLTRLIHDLSLFMVMHLFCHGDPLSLSRWRV